ncbi:hypothetical protein VTL71DRAFT_15679 [Oculimacula yallundae]|uniref:AB hydrolase-1 domain-containing protein n=1 Tax=Oculimacula yallundae TaxID=86028 RepID=A0ABR4CH93_9HELO
MEMTANHDLPSPGTKEGFQPKTASPSQGAQIVGDRDFAGKMEWLGRSHITYHASPTTVRLTKRDTKGQRSLADLCKSTIPACNLNPFLWNGHLQTVWTTLVPDYLPPIYYKRKTFEADEKCFAGSFSVDFVVQEGAEEDPSLPKNTSYFKEHEDISSTDHKPMLIVLHGIAGGSSEAYVRDVLVSLTSNGKWAACVLLSRGCARSKITSRLLYNGRSTWDLRQTVKWLRLQYPNRPLFAMGFSLGANILTSYLADEGRDCHLKAAVVCSNPWNLELSSWSMRRSWIGSEIYSRSIANGLKAYVQLHKEEIREFCTNINLERVNKTVYFHEFDEEVTAPAGGYPTAGAYYRDGSSVDALLAVRVPLLALNALDDPIVPEECLPFANARLNPYCVLCTTTLGGHLGWFELGGNRWVTRAAERFLNSLVDDFDMSQSPEIVPCSEPVDQSPPGLTFDPTQRRLHFRSLSE